MASEGLRNVSPVIIIGGVALVVREFIDDDGRIPFRQWLGELDTAVRARIQARILRFETGNLGDHKEVGDGVWEARMDFGPGYRLYFGRKGREIVVLLAGGDKGTQKRDIKRAKALWSKHEKEG